MLLWERPLAAKPLRSPESPTTDRTHTQPTYAVRPHHAKIPTPTPTLYKSTRSAGITRQ
jgi:hypothetical protein